MGATPVLRRDLLVLYVAMLISRVGFGVIIILFPLYISKSSDIALAAALASYPVLEAITALPMGRLCDTRGRKGVFVISLGAIAALMMSVGLTQNIYAITSIHAVMGVGAAGVTVATLTMVTDLTGRGNRGAGMGAFDFMNVGGYATGIALGDRLRASFAGNLSNAFYVTGLVLAASFAIALVVLKEPSHMVGGREASLNPLRALDSKARAVLPIWLGTTILLGIVFFLPRALSKIGVQAGVTSDILLAGVLVIGMGAVGFGALSDVIGRTKVLLVGVGGLFGLLVSLDLSLPKGFNGLVHYFPYLGISALATSALVPSILAIAGDRATQERRGSAMGLYSVMLSGGTAVGTLVAGFAHRSSGLNGIIDAAIGIFIVACAISAVLWARASVKEKQQPAPE